jgi:hypothetical protein
MHPQFTLLLLGRLVDDRRHDLERAARRSRARRRSVPSDTCSPDVSD